MPQSLSPLLGILQKQVFPSVQESGMRKIIVAHPTWQAMVATDDVLPDGAYSTHKPLKSKRTAFKGHRKYGRSRAMFDARWPEDGLISCRSPILMFVVAGQCAIQLSDYVLHCKAGHGIIIPARTPCSDPALPLPANLSQGSSIDCDILSFMGWGATMECWHSHMCQGDRWNRRAIGESCHILHPKARIYLETLTEEAVLRAPHFRVMCGGLLQVFIALMLREVQELRAYHTAQLHHVLRDSSTSFLPGQDLAVRVEDYVQKHLQEKLSIDRVAAYVYMSRAYFTRQFREETGKTFNEYVTQCRMETAKILLHDTEWPVNKISKFVGITPTRLLALFRQHTKHTPSEFRRKARQGMVDS